MCTGQKRQAYMMEIQRLRDTRILDESGPGPKGSLTISDIRLPLKKEFVTKIGTSQGDHSSAYRNTFFLFGGIFHLFQRFVLMIS